MKRKIIYLLPLLLLTIGLVLIFQKKQVSPPLTSTIESTVFTSTVDHPKNPFEQLKLELETELTDLGEAMIIFVHFQDVNNALISVGDEEIEFPISVTNTEENQFQITTLYNSPSNLVIGSSFGLAQDMKQNYYYYSIEN